VGYRHYGATDTVLKTFPRHAALFAYPNYGMKFGAFKDRKGNIVTMTSTEHANKAGTVSCKSETYGIQVAGYPL